MKAKTFKKQSKLQYGIQILLDIVVIHLGYFLAFLIRFKGITSHIENYYQIALYITLIIIIFEYSYGIYKCGEKDFIEIMMSTVIMLFLLQITTMAISFFSRTFSFPRSIFFISIILQLILFTIYKIIAYKLYFKIYPKKDLIIIDNKTSAENIILKIFQSQRNHFNINYIIPEFNFEKHIKYIKETDVVCLGPEVDGCLKEQVISYCTEYDKMILIIPNLLDISIYHSNLKKIDDVPVFEIENYHLAIEQLFLKRLFDLFFSIMGIIITLPIMILAAISIKIYDRGPVLFRQTRTTINGQKFQVYKFRTMIIDAEKQTGPILAQEKDHRITSIGRILRATRIDELPQFFNILKGDMSLIGPRPERPYFVETYEKEIPHYKHRLNVKAGATGLAQVLGKYTTEPKDKLRYDLLYIRNYSFMLDIKILIQTIKIMLMKIGSGGEEQEVNILEEKVTIVD